MIAFFANLFGYVLNFLYELVKNYGLAIILFSILVKLLMLPISIKQQKTMKKSAKIQEEMKQIQFKYKNEPEKLNQEVMNLYKRENMSPFSGCFSSIVQLILLFSVFYLVRAPLTYMKKIDTNAINQMKAIVQENGATRGYEEIAIIDYVRNLVNQESVEKNEDTSGENVKQNTEINTQNTTESIIGNEQQNNETSAQNNQTPESNQQENDQNNQEQFNIYDYIDQVNLNMDFLGVDLSKVPSQDAKDVKVFIIPVLYVISSFISIKLSTATQNKKIKENENSEEEVDALAQSNKMMVWMMPIMSVSIASIAPLGLALYWLMNNILMIAERLISNKFLKEDDDKEAERNA